MNEFNENLFLLFTFNNHFDLNFKVKTIFVDYFFLVFKNIYKIQKF
jgi:hypothetical protein